jgi:hypothetical protein
MGLITPSIHRFPYDEDCQAASFGEVKTGRTAVTPASDGQKPFEEVERRLGGKNSEFFAVITRFTVWA